MGVHHVEVALVDRRRRPVRTPCRRSGAATASVRELHEVLEVDEAIRSGDRLRGRARTATRTPARTRPCRRRWSTDRAGLRACCVNSRGAVEHRWRAMTRLEAHAVAVDLAPASGTARRAISSRGCPCRSRPAAVGHLTRSAPALPPTQLVVGIWRRMNAGASWCSAWSRRWATRAVRPPPRPRVGSVIAVPLRSAAPVSCPDWP